MKGGMRVAVAVAVGYCLGRRRKLRAAATLAAAGVAAGAAGGLRPGHGAGLPKGLKGLGSPELEKLTGRLRSDVMEVGKAAAVAVTRKQIDALSDRIHDRAEALRNPGQGGGASERPANEG